MILAGLLTNMVVIAAVLWFLSRERDAQRRDLSDVRAHIHEVETRAAQERDDFRKAMLMLVDHQSEQRKELMGEAFRERQVLIERIQRPDQIPAHAAPDPSDQRLFVDPNDDAAYWATVKAADGDTG